MDLGSFLLISECAGKSGHHSSFPFPSYLAMHFIRSLVFVSQFLQYYSPCSPLYHRVQGEKLGVINGWASSDLSSTSTAIDGKVEEEEAQGSTSDEEGRFLSSEIPFPTLYFPFTLDSSIT